MYDFIGLIYQYIQHIQNVQYLVQNLYTKLTILFAHRFCTSVLYISFAHLFALFGSKIVVILTHLLFQILFNIDSIEFIAHYAYIGKLLEANKVIYCTLLHTAAATISAPGQLPAGLRMLHCSHRRLP